MPVKKNKQSPRRIGTSKKPQAASKKIQNDTKVKRINIPKRQFGFKSCKPIKNIFELLMLKKMMCKNMVVIYKYTPADKYIGINSKYNIKQIKEDITNKKFKIPPIVTILINGVFNVISPEHAKIVLAIKGISYKDIIKSDIGRMNISLLIYPYISKDETIKMISTF